MTEVKVIYYGVDERLIDVLDKEKRRYLDKDYTLDITYVAPEVNHNDLCDLVLKNDFDLVMVDLSGSVELDEALRVLYFELNIKGTNIVGLWNELENPNLDKWRYELGIKTHFCYLQTDKSSMADLCLSIIKILEIGNDQNQFYPKQINEPWNIMLPIRINHFSVDEIQFETDTIVRPNDILEFNIPKLPDFPFKACHIERVSQTNLTYNLKYQGTADYAFYDNFEQLYLSKDDGMDELEHLARELSNEIIHEYADETQINEILEQFRENRHLSSEKKAVLKRMIASHNEGISEDTLRALIIDENFNAFKEAPKLIWRYPYKFLLVSSLQDHMDILKSSGSQIVTYVIQKAIPSSRFIESDDFQRISKVAQEISSTTIWSQSEKPMIIIYNLVYNLQELRDLFNYQNLVCIQEPFSFDSMIKIVRDYVNSRENKRGNYSSDAFEKISPKFHSDMGHGFICKEVKLNSISENEVIFESEFDIGKGSSFKITVGDDIAFFGTIVEIPKTPEDHTFKALIHSLNEKEKKELRKYIFSKEAPKDG